MKKVLVIGSPGTGKTSLAVKLAQKTGLPLIHLDKYYNNPAFGYETNKPAWRRKVQELLKAKQWIIDGNFVSTLDLRAPAADTIIFLNYPRYICFWRIFKRRLQYHRKQRPDMPDTWKEKADWGFYKYVWRFKKENIPEIESTLEQNKDKDIVILTSPAQTKNFLSKIPQLFLDS